MSKELMQRNKPCAQDVEKSSNRETTCRLIIAGSIEKERYSVITTDVRGLLMPTPGCRRTLKKHIWEKKIISAIKLVSFPKIVVKHINSLFLPGKKRYQASNQLKRHIFTVHLQIKISCQVTGCRKDFIRKDSYKNHLLTKHKNIRGQEMNKLLDNVQKLYIPEIDKNQEILH
jgi:hypothetical protein